MMLTDQELQTLRNRGNEAEAAADEIERLREERDAAAAAERERLAAVCWERRGHFASDAAARAFAELVRAGRA